MKARHKDTGEIIELAEEGIISCGGRRYCWYQVELLPEPVDVVQPSLPSDLDEAAEEYEDWVESYSQSDFPTCVSFRQAFKAGAEWMVGQGWKEVSATDYPKPDRDKIYCVYTQKDYPYYLLAKVINHPDDDELLQWKCTQYPFTRYDMCEGDSYLEIRKKQ